jgi:ArsR family transcriptional regulator, arsenate/arsenite/antimonite-responsive transcriptional repressor
MKGMMTMPYTKADLFKEKDLQVSRMAKALSHPARVAILRELARKSECICGHIVDLMPLAQSTVSQHLKELRKAGLISGEIDGPRSCYCINGKAIRNCLVIFQRFLDELQSTGVPKNIISKEAICKSPQKN